MVYICRGAALFAVTLSNLAAPKDNWSLSCHISSHLPGKCFSSLMDWEKQLPGSFDLLLIISDAH